MGGESDEQQPKGGKAVIWLNLIISAVLCLMFFAGCSYRAVKEDFALTVSFCPSEKDEDIFVFAQFENLSKHALKITSHTEAGENLIKIYCVPKGADVNDEVASLAVKSYLAVGARIQKTETFSDLQSGEYEIFAYVRFYQKDNFFNIKSNILEFNI